MSALAYLLAAVALVQEPAEAPAQASEPAGAPGSAPAQPPSAAAPPETAPTAPPAAKAPAREKRAPSPAPPAAPLAPRASPAPQPQAAPAGPDAEREDAARVARAFLEALARGDPDALAALAPERFSFDGDVQSGRDAIRRTWRSILAGRPGPPPTVGRVDVMTVPEAVARHGQPPARVAPLARPGALVAFGDVAGRQVVLFLVREAGRTAVAGMHD